MTPAGIKPATFRFVPQHLNHCATAVPLYVYIYICIQLKLTLEHATKTQRGSRVTVLPFFNRGARWGGWSAPRPGRFTPGKDPVPIVQVAGWASVSVWVGAENFAPHRDSIL